jgi:hypothetical protein
MPPRLSFRFCSTLLLLLLVTAATSFRAGSALGAGVAAVAAPTAATASLNFYFGNLHAHTAYSDGTGTPKEAYSYARTKGKLDFLAVTEHNHAAAEGTGDDPLFLHVAKDSGLYSKLIDHADTADKDGEFVTIYGQEFSAIKTGGNHTNVFMARKVITTKNGDYKTVFTDGWMDEYDVELIQFNHPWEMGIPSNKIGTPQDKNYGFNKYPNRAAFVEAVDGRVTLVEVINGPGTKNPAPGQVFKSKRDGSYYMRYLNMGLHVAPTADQDNHWRTWGTLTQARTVVLAPKLTRKEVLKALKERRVYATQDSDLKIHLTVNGEPMGSRLEALDDGEEVTVEVRLEDDDDDNSSYLVSLYYDDRPGFSIAKVVEQATVDNNEGVTFTHAPKSGRGYYFIEVKSTKGGNKGLMAWTAPVWLE